jgi:cell division protein FtsB
MALYHHIHSQNEKKKQQLDELFIERKEMENEISDLEHQMQDIQMSNEV